MKQQQRNLDNIYMVRKQFADKFFERLLDLKLRLELYVKRIPHQYLSGLPSTSRDCY